MSTPSTLGRVAAITGASSGSGAATARALVADELGPAEVVIEADVTDRASLVAAAARVRDELGGADVLVNNAGVMLLGPFTPTSARSNGACVIVIEPGAVTTELVGHITHADTKQAIEQFYAATSITADDIAQIIAFAVSRPRSVSINEILVRPTGQAG